MTGVLLALAVLGAVPWVTGWSRTAEVAPRDPELAGLSLDPAVLLDLAGAVLASGSSVPTALRVLGEALAGVGDRALAASLSSAGELLVLGAGWEEAWEGAPASATVLSDCLEPAWDDGADPAPLLQLRARALRADAAREAEEAAAKLGVRLVLPLGLCFLPAFILLGIVPVVLGAGLDLLR
ncbi:Possible conserved alanine rich membrane protein [Actinomycetales bacterium JB111]|nr:Possible conserved alanine rich membrane protein [Actinomycetales bacterium JB111]